MEMHDEDRARPPDEVTEPGAQFFKSAETTLGLLEIVTSLALHSDYASEVARRALAGEEWRGVISPIELAKKDPGPSTQRLRKHRQALLEMLLTREVDNFTTYLTEGVRAVMMTTPEMAKSGQEVRVDYVLSFETIEAFTREIIERKVIDLGYLGLSDLEDWLQDRMGLTMFPDDESRAIAREAIEARNAIVHVRGVIGDKYLKAIPDSPFSRGQLRELTIDDLFKLWKALTATVSHIDSSLASKFKLPTSELSSWARDRGVTDKPEASDAT